MKKQLILGLLSSIALHMPSAMAYSSLTGAYAEGSLAIGDDFAFASTPTSESEASVNRFDLHSYSSVTDYYYGPDTNRFFALEEAGDLDLMMYSGIITAGLASYSETFKVVAAGSATLDFGWDGSLGADAGSDLTAGYQFLGSSSGLSVGDSGENINGTGDTVVNSGGSIALFFTEEQVGTTFDVEAYLFTYISDNLRDECDSCEAIHESSNRSAFADFADTATLSFTGGIAAVPVPAAVWLLGSALVGLVGIRRRTV